MPVMVMRPNIQSKFARIRTPKKEHLSTTQRSFHIGKQYITLSRFWKWRRYMADVCTNAAFFLRKSERAYICNLDAFSLWSVSALSKCVIWVNLRHDSCPCGRTNMSGRCHRNGQSTTAKENWSWILCQIAAARCKLASFLTWCDHRDDVF